MYWFVRSLQLITKPFPTRPNYVPIWFVTAESNEPFLSVPVSETGGAKDHLTMRHDGWTGEAMAKFLETLAETGIVLDACDAAGRSRQAAYALRRRDPLFAQAWELALGNARERLADTLLARSLEGNVEQIIKDGVIVAEKHFLDNRLGLAILKRLDKRAEEFGALRRAASLRQAEPDWDVALSALRTGSPDKIAAALAMFLDSEVDKVDTPSFEDGDGDTDSVDRRRVWREWRTEEWRTDFPPPSGFSGFEQDDWEDVTYCRALTDEELAALVAAGIADPDEAATLVSIEQDEAERDLFFSSLVAKPGDSASTCQGQVEKAPDVTALRPPQAHFP